MNPSGGVEWVRFQECNDRKRMKTYDNDGHHFVTATGTLVAFTRCWKWQQGFQDDPTPH